MLPFANPEIPFLHPERFLAALAAGGVRRIGATLREVKTGRILAHLVETGALPQALGTAGPGGTVLGLAKLLASAGQLASSVWANVQLRQIAAMLSGLQFLTGAALAASVAGVGVSVAGFALVLRRLDDVEKTLQAVRSDALDARLAAERVEVRVATRDRARMESSLQRGEEAWVRADATAVWKDLEGALDLEQRYWRGLVGGGFGPSILCDPRFTFDQAVAAYEAALALAAARVQALLLVGEMAAARSCAREFHQWHDRTMFGLSPIEIANARSGELSRRTAVPESDARSRLLPPARDFVRAAREIQLQVADRVGVIESLIGRGIEGRAYVQALRERTDAPVLVLPAA